MAYLALYRKWRPRTFTEVVGQRHISIPLMRAIEQDRLAHAYLFSGPRGTGKTSMAKILAKAVNCLHPDGANPCNECQNCKEINAGSSLDVYEIDAASNRGIEEIRALKESVRTLPSTCRKKVYIIDEVHMLTKEAFNALLKTLEEPPAHVLFILATTEPEKIPLTILSRCQRYEFHRISVEDIKQHLLHVSKESGIPLTEDAADLIAVRADGGLRDALSLLDQCSSASEAATLDAETVYNLLGLTGKDQIIQLSHHIFKGESGEALTLFYQILQNGKEPASILRDLLEHFRNLMICRVNPNAPELSAYGKRVADLRADAQQLTPSYLDGLFDYLHEALTETKRSSSPRMSAEMGLIRLCHIRGTKTIESLTERVENLEKAIDALRKGAPLPAGAAPRPAQPEPQFPTPPPRGGSFVPNFPPQRREPAPPNFPPQRQDGNGFAPGFPPQGGQPGGYEPDVPPPEEEYGDSYGPQFPPAPDFPQPEEEFPGSQYGPARPQPRNFQTPPTPSPQPQRPPERRAPVDNKPAPQPRQAPPQPAPAKPAGTLQGELIDPSTYPTIWRKVLSYFIAIHRVDINASMQKSTLIYATKEHAVISAPQRFLVLAGNNPSYQKVAQEAFQHVCGSPILPHTVLRGSPEEAEALAELKAAQSSSTPAAPAPAPTKSADGYHPVSPDDIPTADKNDPSLKEALKILPDYDIYEKD